MDPSPPLHEVALQFAGGARRVVGVRREAFELGFRIMKDEGEIVVSALKSDLRDAEGRTVYIALEVVSGEA